MPTLSFHYDTDAERLELERACAYVAEMRQLGRTAAYGTVLDTLECFALDKGRALLRDNLAATVQARATSEKKVSAIASAALASAT